MTVQRPTDVAAIDDWNRLLDGKVAVVTGGGDGIGGAISRLFAEHGALVEIAEIDPDRAEPEPVRHRGRRRHRARARRRRHRRRRRRPTRRRRSSTRTAASTCSSTTSATSGRWCVSQKSTPESWDGDVQDQPAPLLRGHARVPRLDDRTTAVARSSTCTRSKGMRGYPGEPVYGAMKAAVAHFTTCLAVDQGRHGIRVNGIGPDLTQTPQVDYITGFEEHDDLWPSWAPVGRLGWPEDQARVALFLASDLSGYVTGHNIPVDGGTKAGGGWFWSPSIASVRQPSHDPLSRTRAARHRASATAGGSDRVAGDAGARPARSGSLRAWEPRPRVGGRLSSRRSLRCRGAGRIWPRGRVYDGKRDRIPGAFSGARARPTP